MNKCPSCGGDKKLHSERGWKVHQDMHKNYMKVQRELARYKKLDRVRKLKQWT